MREFRRAAVTITAADPDGLQANQGFSVTVEAESTNNPPVAQGTIPGSSLQIGSTSTIDAAGYFSDPDGDELSYTGASSNEGVATVAMDGSSATITAVAAGDAVITITASDGSASASQGFRVEVSSGPKQATVAIFGLRAVENRSVSINPTNVSGNISVILDVQPNDETVTGIALTLGDETIQCRGTSADASLIAGLAESGGQLEVDCLLDTDAVNGECVGMQLDPTYANGDYALGAFLTTDEGETRSVVATQAVTLKNSGFVIITHQGSDNSVVSNTTKGLEFFGRAAEEGNDNAFHACPVSYTGTTVGELQLGSIHTNTARPPVATDPQPGAGQGLLSFRRARSGRYGSHAPADNEPPFTWPISFQSWTGNSAVENVPGDNEYWIENRGLIKNTDGLDVSAEFRTEGATHKEGPFQFDFSAPRVNQNDGSSEVVVSLYSGGSRVRRSVAAGEYFSDGSPFGTSTRLEVSNVAESGVGGVSEAIAVGDCSVSANTDNRSSTAFVALFDDIRNISELPENDAAEDVGDDGVDCYFAELQSLTDALGNSRSLSNISRIQTAAGFGVDHGALTFDEVEPEQGAVLGFASTSDTDVYLYVHDVEDPDLETGERGSGVASATPQRLSSGSWGTLRGITATNADRDLFQFNVTGLGEGSHTMRALLWDNANPGNLTIAPISFVKDTRAPTFTAGAGPGAVNAGSSAQITIMASGTIKDANVIDEALLTVWANNGSTAICGGEDDADTMLPANRATRVDLENDTKTIEFEQAMTIKRPPAAGGAEQLCFHLSVKDVATDEEGDDDGANTAVYSAGNFSVNWGLGMTIAADENAGGGATLNSEGELEIAETETGTYTVKLDAQPAGPVTVTVTFGEDGLVTTNDSTFVFASTQAEIDDGTAVDAGAATPTLWNAVQTVSVTTRDEANDADDPEDARNETMTITHTASGGGYDGVAGSVPLTVLDNDIEVLADPDELEVAASWTEVEITVRAAQAVTAETTVTVTFAPDPSGASDGIRDAGDESDVSGGFDIIIPAGDREASGTVEINPGNGSDDDGEIVLAISAPSGARAKTFTIEVVDP